MLWYSVRMEETHYKLTGKVIRPRHSAVPFDMKAALETRGFYNVSHGAIVSDRPRYRSYEAYEFEGWAETEDAIDDFKNNVADSKELFEDIHYDVAPVKVF